MKEIRAFLDALSEARSLADVNIAAGAALPVIAKFARRTVAVGALALLVTTAALAQGYTRLDHRLKQADEKHQIMLTTITKTTRKQQRVMVSRIVKANKARERLATEIQYLRTQPATSTAPTQAGAPLSQPVNAVVVTPASAPSGAAPTSTLAEEPAAAAVEQPPVETQPPPAPPVATAPPPRHRRLRLQLRLRHLRHLRPTRLRLRLRPRASVFRCRRLLRLECRLASRWIRGRRRTQSSDRRSRPAAEVTRFAPRDGASCP